MTRIMTIVLSAALMPAALWADPAAGAANPAGQMQPEMAQLRADRIDRRIDARLDRQERQEQVSASVNNPNEESLLAQEAMATFDGAQAESTSQAQPISIEDGVALMSRTDELTDTYVRPARRRCYPGMRGSAHSCRRIPAAMVEEHQVTSNYQIVDRNAYVDSQASKGALTGGLVGGSAGLLLGVLITVLAGTGVGVGLASTLAIAIGFAGLGVGIGVRAAAKAAREKPEEFTEVEERTTSERIG